MKPINIEEITKDSARFENPKYLGEKFGSHESLCSAFSKHHDYLSDLPSADFSESVEAIAKSLLLDHKNPEGAAALVIAWNRLSSNDISQELRAMLDAHLEGVGFISAALFDVTSKVLTVELREVLQSEAQLMRMRNNLIRREIGE